MRDNENNSCNSCIIYKSILFLQSQFKTNSIMNEKEFFLDLLMKKKAEMKMLEYIFYSGRKISESKMNAVLDRRKQLEKDIETIEDALKKLEKK